MAHIEANEYTVKFDANGASVSGTMEDQDMVYGEPQNLFKNKFTREKATFAGWNTKADGTGTVYTDGQRVQNLTTENEGTMTLYAQWILQKEPAGVFLAQATAKGKKSLKIQWNPINGADGYDVFLSRCNKGKKARTPKLVKTLSGGTATAWTKKGLKKRKAYKAYVQAWKMENGSKTYIARSPLIHVYTSGKSGKYTNPKGVTVEQADVTLNTGGSHTIKAKVTKVKKGKKIVKRG